MPITEQIDALVKESNLISEELENKDVVIDNNDNIETKDEIKVDITEDVEALFNGEETLSEEFKTKAATIFEAAVVTRVKQEVTRLEEKFDAELEEHKEEVKAGLVEHVDGFLNYVVEQWLSDNEVALESGIKLEISENLISGLHNLLKENNINIPEEELNLVSEIQEKLDETTAKLDETVQANIELVKTINEGKRTTLINKLSEGLTDVDAEKFRTLVEDFVFEDAESYEAKLTTIKEGYFNKKQSTSVDTVVDVITDNPVVEQDLKEGKTEKSLSPFMQAIKAELAKNK